MSDPTPRRPPGPHPSPEDLYWARHGATDPAAQRALEHAVSCAECSEELLRQEAFDRPQPLAAGKLETEWERFERELDRPAASLDAPRAGRTTTAAPVTRSRSRRFLRPPALALAAALAAVVGLTAWLATRPPPTLEDPLRGGPSGEQSFTPIGDLGAPPVEFTFPAAGGEPQRVLVFDTGGTYRWTSEPTVAGKVAFPEAERKKLTPGADYYWTLLDGDGGTPARSFRVQPPS